MFDSWQYDSTKCAPQYELNSYVTMEQTGFQTSLLWPPSAVHFDICQQHLICMIQQAYKYVSSSFRPCLTFAKLKITDILKSTEWGLEKSELPWEQNVL